MQRHVEVAGRSFALSESLASDELAPIFADAWTASTVWAASRFLSQRLVAVASLASSSSSSSHSALATSDHADVAAAVAAVQQRRGLQLKPLQDGATAVELGAGCGLVGLVAAALGADVVLTDQREAVELLERNAQANAADEGERSRLRVREFVWGVSAQAAGLPRNQFDYVLVSDCINPIYGADSWRSLARSIRELSHAESLALLAHESRGDDSALADFLQTCDALGLEAQRVAHEGKTSMFALWRRSETSSAE
jgi:hypothetical protein